MIQQLFGFLSYFIPEIICVVLMTTLLVAESTVKEEHGSRGKIIGYALAMLALCLLFLFQNLGEAPRFIFHNAITIDPFSTLIKIIMVLGTMGAIFLSYSSKDIYTNLKSEFAIMAVGVLLGGMQIFQRERVVRCGQLLCCGQRNQLVVCCLPRRQVLS